MTPAQLEELDERILATVPGDETAMADLLDRRHQALEAVLAQPLPVAEIEAIRSRTARMEEKVLHWRRTAMMELSDIDQHLRYLDQQVPGATCPAPTRLDISA